MKWKVATLLVVMVVLALVPLGVQAGKPPGTGHSCTRIQDGTLHASDSSLITLGYDKWGYNYQAHMFNGGYCDAYGPHC